MSSLKYLVYLLLLSLTSSGCDQELVKWEFLARPNIIEIGIFDRSGVNIKKTITKNDIIGRLDLPSGAEIRTVKVNAAAVYLNLDQNIIQPDSLFFEVYCSAFPGKASYSEKISLKPGTLSYGYEESILFTGTFLQAVEAINKDLDELLQNGQSLDFTLTVRTFPSGAIASGSVSFLVLFDVVYWECVEVPEFAMLSDANKGPCQ